MRETVGQELDLVANLRERRGQICESKWSLQAHPIPESHQFTCCPHMMDNSRSEYFLDGLLHSLAHLLPSDIQQPPTHRQVLPLYLFPLLRSHHRFDRCVTPLSSVHGLFKVVIVLCLRVKERRLADDGRCRRKSRED